MKRDIFPPGNAERTKKQHRYQPIHSYRISPSIQRLFTYLSTAEVDKYE